MRLVVKEKIISIGGKYYIKDRDEKDVYIVRGSIMFPKKFYVQDMREKEIIKIKKKMFRIFATWDFYINDKVVCRAKRKFSLKPKYEITGELGSYTISGSILQWDYTINKGETPIATVFKKITLYRDSYLVDIDDESETPVILGISIMFDYVHHRHNSSRF